jgi:hypothetical protein
VWLLLEVHDRKGEVASLAPTAVQSVVLTLRMIAAVAASWLRSPCGNPLAS